MNRIIALHGDINKGKTTSLKMVLELIKTKYSKAKIEPKNDKTNDIKCIITIGKFKIGIETQGDPGGRLKDSLKEFIKLGCNIIICAIRVTGVRAENFIDVIKHKKTHEILLIKKDPEASASQYVKSNLKTAKKILKEIEVLIKK